MNFSNLQNLRVFVYEKKNVDALIVYGIENVVILNMNLFVKSKVGCD